MSTNKITGLECRDCGSTNTEAFTGDKELEKDHLLIWHCCDCEEVFYTGSDILSVKN